MNTELILNEKKGINKSEKNIKTLAKSKSKEVADEDLIDNKGS